MRAGKPAVLYEGLRIVQLGRSVCLWTKCSAIRRERRRGSAGRWYDELLVANVFNKVKRAVNSLRTAGCLAGLNFSPLI